MNLLRTAETIVAFGKSEADTHYNRVLMSAVPSLVCNFLYALYHGVMGVINLSLCFLSCVLFTGFWRLCGFARSCPGEKNSVTDRMFRSGM